MPRFMLTVAYDGTDFHGWQKQEPPGAEPLRTVQAVVETAVRETVREPVLVQGASRTDSGVHALGQVAAFTSDTALEPERLLRALNARLPDDALVRDVRTVPAAFDPVSDAEEKEYHYTVAHAIKAGRPRPLFDRRTVWTCAEVLDPAAMAEAAAHVVGTHDFASFAKTGHGRESTVRTVTGCTVLVPAEDRVTIAVRGEGFLHNMVRIIAGTLVDVGRGRRCPDDVPGIVAAADRAAAGPTLGPEGLRLEWIRYPAEALDA